MGVLGIDACRAGWAGIVLADDGSVHAAFDAELGGLLGAVEEAYGRPAAIGVDMPIGLPEAGPRRCDELVRGRLGPRRSSLFVTPVRAALAEPTYAAVNAVNRRLTGQGVSRQAYALRPRILEVDAIARAAPGRLHEVHPELSFATLAGAPLPHAKRTWAGAALRRRLLRDSGVDVPDDLGRLGAVAAVDDVLDAAVVAWTARRIAAGVAAPHPDPPEVLSGGTAAAIWA